MYSYTVENTRKMLLCTYMVERMGFPRAPRLQQPPRAERRATTPPRPTMQDARSGHMSRTSAPERGRPPRAAYEGSRTRVEHAPQILEIEDMSAEQLQTRIAELTQRLRGSSIYVQELRTGQMPDGDYANEDWEAASNAYSRVQRYRDSFPNMSERELAEQIHGLYESQLEAAQQELEARTGGGVAQESAEPAGPLFRQFDTVRFNGGGDVDWRIIRIDDSRQTYLLFDPRMAGGMTQSDIVSAIRNPRTQRDQQLGTEIDWQTLEDQAHRYERMRQQRTGA